MKFHIVIAEYLPEFFDGRISRISSLENYFLEINQNYLVYSSGANADIDNNVKYGCYWKSSSISKTSPVAKTVSFRAKCFDFVQSTFKLLYRNLVIVDYQLLNVIALVRALNRNFCRSDANILILSMPKFSILFSVFLLNKRKYERLIFDFRDLPYTHRLLKGNPISHFLVKSMILLLGRRNDTVFWVTNTNAENYLRAVLPNKANVRVVPNGFVVQKYTSTRVENVSHSIAYFGNIGGIRNIHSTHTKLLTTYSSVHFYGLVDFTTRKILGNNYKGLLPRTEIPNHAAAYDHLLVIISEAEDAACAIPGKVYEYMSFRKPVILVCPKGSAVEEMLDEIQYPYRNITTGVCRLERSMPSFENLQSKYLRRNIWQNVFKEYKLNEES
jgi:hypothetical protein